MFEDGVSAAEVSLERNLHYTPISLAQRTDQYSTVCRKRKLLLQVFVHSVSVLQERFAGSQLITLHYTPNDRNELFLRLRAERFEAAPEYCTGRRESVQKGTAQERTSMNWSKPIWPLPSGSPDWRQLSRSICRSRWRAIGCFAPSGCSARNSCTNDVRATSSAPNLFCPHIAQLLNCYVM